MLSKGRRRESCGAEQEEVETNKGWDGEEWVVRITWHSAATEGTTQREPGRNQDETSHHEPFILTFIHFEHRGWAHCPWRHNFLAPELWTTLKKLLLATTTELFCLFVCFFIKDFLLLPQASTMGVELALLGLHEQGEANLSYSRLTAVNLQRLSKSGFSPKSTPWKASSSARLPVRHFSSCWTKTVSDRYELTQATVAIMCSRVRGQALNPASSQRFLSQMIISLLTVICNSR